MSVGRPPNARSAFSLVELLVSVAIMSLLMAVLLPVLRSAREAALSAACLSNLRQLAAAVHMYAQDNAGYLPYIPPWQHNNMDGTLYICGGPSYAYDDKGTGECVTIDGYLPAPQNRVLNRYTGIGRYDIYKCGSDKGYDLHEYYPQICWMPSLWQYTGSSYFFNDYALARHPSVDESDFGESPWNKRLGRLPNGSRFVLFYEPPAQNWPWGYGPNPGKRGKVFRWHRWRGGTGSFTYDQAGDAPFWANIAFADGHAEAVDFSSTFIRDPSGTIIGQSRKAGNVCWWYIPK